MFSALHSVGAYGATMQVELDDENLGERSLWQVGEEEFVDDACTRDADGALLFGGLMGCHGSQTRTQPGR